VFNKDVKVPLQEVELVGTSSSNKQFLCPILGRRNAVVALNGRFILVWNALYVPGLAVPLHSLHAHLKQPGCGFMGTLEAGILAYFPTFILLVDTTSDCHLSYEPLGWMVPLWNLHYIHPWCPPDLYHLEVDPSTCIVSHDLMTIPNGPVLIEDNSTDVTSLALVPPVLPSSGNLAFEASTLQSMSTLLQSLNESVCLLTSSTPLPSTPLVSSPTMVPDSTAPPIPSSSPCLLSTMLRQDVICLLHHEGSTLPAVPPCNTANQSDTKTHWMAKELHCIMGCWKFQNYKHLLQVSQDGEWVDGGEFPPLLSLFATIPKAKRVDTLDKTKYEYVDAVHMDIMCLLAGFTIMP
jgi:hypothetical protein